MSDEEDTAILLDKTEHISTEKEIKIVSDLSIQRDLVQNNKFTRQEAFLSATVVLLCGFILGYDTTLATSASKQITHHYSLGCDREFFIIVCWLIGAITSCIFGGFLIDSGGRRFSIILSMTLYITSCILTSLSKSFDLFLLSRIVAGFAGSLSSMAVCIYISEVSDSCFRGSKISLHKLGSAIGALLACIICSQLNVESSFWKISIVLNGNIAICTAVIAVFWLPQSPHFILTKKTKSLKRNASKLKITILFETFLIALLLAAFQELCGRHSVLSYAPRLFSLLGLCFSEAKQMAVLTFAVVKLLSTCLALFIIDKLGRRTSLIIGTLIMAFSITFLALITTMDNEKYNLSPPYADNCRKISVANEKELMDLSKSIEKLNIKQQMPKYPPPYPLLPTPIPWSMAQSVNCPEIMSLSGLQSCQRVLAIIGLLVYEAGYALGIGTVCLVILAEIFPAILRGRAMASIMGLHWISDFVIPNNFIQIGKSPYTTFLTYGAICSVAAIVAYLLLPETRNCTLHQVAQDLRSVSLLTRAFRNASVVPLFRRCGWLRTRAERQRVRHTVPVAQQHHHRSTVI